MSAVCLRLPEELAKRLQLLAERTGRSKTYYMLEAIRAHLDDLEDLEDLHLAEQRLRSVRAGRMGTVTLDEVMQRDGLEG